MAARANRLMNSQNCSAPIPVRSISWSVNTRSPTIRFPPGSERFSMAGAQKWREPSSAAVSQADEDDVQHLLLRLSDRHGLPRDVVGTGP